MDLVLSTDVVAGHAVLRVAGEIDVYTAPRLRERLAELVNNGVRHLVIDMSSVDFLDSTGCGVLVGALKWLRAVDGTIGIVAPHERMLKIFRITALDRVFPLYSSVDEAVARPVDGGPVDGAAAGSAKGSATGETLEEEPELTVRQRAQVARLLRSGRHSSAAIADLLSVPESAVRQVVAGERNPGRGKPEGGNG